MHTVPLFEQFCCNGVILPETLEHPRPCQLYMEQEMEQVGMMTTGCKSTLSRKAREGQRQTPKSEMYSSKQHKQHRHPHVQELWKNWTLGEKLLETR